MRKLYGILWGAWFVTYGGLEMYAFAVPWYAWVGMFLAFMPIELIGALKSAPGDTFSEFIWTFVRGGDARDPFSICLAAALAYRFATLPLLIEGWNLGIFNLAPWGLLSAGMFLWLANHFPNLGKEG